jgi:hypothetical protein
MVGSLCALLTKRAKPLDLSLVCRIIKVKNPYMCRPCNRGVVCLAHQKENDTRMKINNQMGSSKTIYSSSTLLMVEHPDSRQ